jgi:ferredoxin
MKYVELIFSPTGGTEKVAHAVTGAWNVPVETVDLCDPAMPAYTFGPDDVALLAVPSFGGRVPGTAAERISKVKGNGARCVIVCVYGNRAYEDTLVELEDVAKQSGFTVVAAIAGIAEHSIMHQYAAGRPDAQDVATLSAYGKRIFEKLQNGSAVEPSKIPGNRPYKKAGGAGLVPKANDRCTGCGLCAEKCPVQAIGKEDLKTADNKKCISCMRCIAICPQNARSINSAMVAVASLAIKKACSVKKECELYL